MVTLEESYDICKGLNKRFDKGYYFLSHLLPTEKRRHIYALYGLYRYAREVSDKPVSASPEDRIESLEVFAERFFTDLGTGISEEPVLMAAIDTIVKFDIPKEYFGRFLNSMRMDIERSSFGDFSELSRYMDGSAGVVGEIVQAVLGVSSDLAIENARELGIAIQLTYFIRDISTDLDRQKIYIPQDEIEGFGAAPAFESRKPNDGFKELLKFEIARTRDLYERSKAGDKYFDQSGQKCISATRSVNSQILDRIESVDYDVFSVRVQVPALNKLRVLAGARLLRNT
ncbi:MAG: phytoene/squalene synthase family protein [Acidimicrobiaceae bacterium]|nr:phytoene/squalene synthase family protein [Acidimicrobiaceae bacterium]